MGSLILACLGENFETALGASAACIGNVGPAIGKAGPVSNFSEIHWAGKWLLSCIIYPLLLETIKKAS